MQNLENIPATPGIRLVYVTAPNLETARRLARTLVEERLVACANLLPEMRSVYAWEGAIEEAAEVVVILKTTPALSDAVERRVRELHPYQVPCILFVEVAAASEPFARWLADAVRGPGGQPSK